MKGIIFDAIKGRRLLSWPPKFKDLYRSYELRKNLVKTSNAEKESGGVWRLRVKCGEENLWSVEFRRQWFQKK